MPSTLLSPGGDPPPGGDNCAYPEPVEGGRAIHYSYDGLGRLVEAAYGTGICYQYRYDQVGNRETMTTTTTLGSTSAVTYTYDTANRLTHVGGITLTWDNAGNLLEDQDGAAYTYNVAKRLTRVVQDGITYTFGYNGLGDRIQQTVLSEVTTYTLDLYADLTQVLADGTNAYLYGLGRIGEEQPSGRAYHLPDSLGSVRQLTDEKGWVTLVRTHIPYGGILKSDGTAATVYGYTGEWLDAYIKLIYLRSRYYAPYLNQFIQPDPIIPRPENPQDWNKYSYVRNNPVNLVDPSGRCIPGYNCPNDAPLVTKRLIVSRDRWGALPPGYYVTCPAPWSGCELGSVIGEEGFYHPVFNEAGYACYTDLIPDRSLDDILDTVVIHHEGNFQSYDVAAVQLQHMFDTGYTDIGYHFVIGPDGTIYEGRDIGVRGAHVLVRNTGMVGVLLLGDFEPGLVFEVPMIGEVRFPYDSDDPGPTARQVQSTIDLIRWLDYEYGIDTVVGHRDVNSTICPGEYCVPYIPIFNQVAQEY